MTEDEAFKTLAAQNLAGFGYSITPEEIPSVDVVYALFGRLLDWWNGLSDETRALVGDFDLATPMWNNGWFNDFPSFYNLVAGNPFVHFKNTMENVRSCFANADDRKADYAAQHAVGHLEDDPGLQHAGEENYGVPEESEQQ